MSPPKYGITKSITYIASQSLGRKGHVIEGYIIISVSVKTTNVPLGFRGDFGQSREASDTLVSKHIMDLFYVFLILFCINVYDVYDVIYRSTNTNVIFKIFSHFLWIKYTYLDINNYYVQKNKINI